MSKTKTIYIILWLLIQLLIEVNSQTNPFIPIQRYGHTATIIDSKIYFLGGRDVVDTDRSGREFFYFEVSGPFNTQNILWHDLTNINTVPAHLSAASVKGGINNKNLFLYGGVEYYKATMSLVYTFDTLSNSWSIPKITGDNVIRKDNLKGIVDDKGKLYLFGGRYNGTILNDMLILDTISLTWKIGSSINAPSPRDVYGAVYISKQFIVYLGGYYATSYIDGVSLSLKEIYYYDMIGNLWLTRVTTGTIPSDRDSFSAVLGLDGQQVIIFGGTNALNNLKPQDTLYVLNLLNYEWSIPKVSGLIPGSRYWHEANVIGRYMVISFGFGYDSNVDNDILLLDISNNEEYIWTNNFDPNDTIVPPPVSPNNDSPTSTSIPVMIGISVGTCVVVISLLFGGFYLYKWRKTKTENMRALPTPGSASDNNFNHGALAIPTRTVYNYGQEAIPTHENSYY
ncbi:4164_t:CDS:2 [Funneliformis caledonium]|uniref:4164_t:CDS:1 n=1 Tax=Funneliformis caledonium TaxID=1117310 RepID=A0A9N9N459_9GLOM|nr:4164_t:CDS:2 [Funneliformis caledonium]